ncbi:MAG: PLP-dependent transferase [Bryobacterales bacterium]|nr:PLP-dependent transferase [Bryobacterales bacterium]
MKTSRRNLLKSASVAGLPAVAVAAAPAAAAAVPDVYTPIGVRPIINARGTFTIVSGSTMLPEARSAMEAASQRYVHMDELMDAAGAKLAQLTGAEFGMVTNGCSAAITHATAACVAGGNPDLHVRIPDLRGFAKDEVIVPTHSRNVYDAAIRAVGVRIVEVSTPEELELAIGPRTAMVYILAGPSAERGPLAFEALVKIVAPHKVPILVDAAAEILTIPNFHLQRGATLVTYSGGKCIRGPQTAGLLLGKKSIVQAAWVHSAPHHGFARSLKIGKEETMGMLAAVEAWTKRDHNAEWQRWLGWLNTVKARLAPLAHLQLSIEEPKEQLSNRTPALQVRWDAAKFGVTGVQMGQMLMSGQPRMTVATQQNGINVVAYMMAPGDAEQVAEVLHKQLSALKEQPKKDVSPAQFDLSGRWAVRIEFLSGSSTHHLDLLHKAAELSGTHQGDFASRPIRGGVNGAAVDFASSLNENHGDSLQFRFTGLAASANEMSGKLDMGEYRNATWTAKRVIMNSRRG